MLIYGQQSRLVFANRVVSSWQGGPVTWSLLGPLMRSEKQHLRSWLVLIFFFLTRFNYSHNTIAKTAHSLWPYHSWFLSFQITFAVLKRIFTTSNSLALKYAISILVLYYSKLPSHQLVSWRLGLLLWLWDFKFIFFSDEIEEYEQTIEEADPNVGRFVRYQFTPQFLRLKHVGAT